MCGCGTRVGTSFLKCQKRIPGKEVIPGMEGPTSVAVEKDQVVFRSDVQVRS